MVKRIKSSKGHKGRLLILLPTSVAFIIIALVLAIVDPTQLVANYRSRLTKDSEIIDVLTQQDAPSIHLSAYLFNVTNAERFLSGEDHKLKVEEVGPFTYLEQRSNVDFELDEAAGVMRYTPRSKVKFLPEKSIADPRKVNVSMPNVAMLSMSSMITSHPYLTRVGFSLLLSHLRTKAVVPMTAHEFLWGYEEPLISLGNTLLPGWISFETLGILDRLFDRNVEYNLEVGISGSDKFKIKSMNGFRGLTAWDYDDTSKRTECNTFINAFEGLAYPNKLAPGTPLRLFRNVLCRFLELDYQGIVRLDDNVEALSYKISDSNFRINNETECLCSRGTCIEGVSDLSPCFYELPLALSNPHFTHGDPKLLERIEGVKPDPEKYRSEILIDRKVGMVLKTEFAVQVNVVVKNVDFNEEAGRFANMVVPVGYFKMVQPELMEQNKNVLKLLYVVGPYCFWTIIIVLLIAAALMIAYSIQLFLSNLLYSKEITFHSQNQEKPPTIQSAVPLLES